MDKVSHHVSHIGYVIRADSGKQPDPKCVFRNDIGIGQISDSAILIAAHVGLPGQVSAEEQPGPYFIGIEVPDKIIPFERCPVTNRQQEAEPGGVASGSGLRQDEIFFKFLK